MPCYLWNNLSKREVFKSKKIKIEEKWTAVAIQARYDMGKQIAIRFGLHFWGPFLESPANFSGPKTNIQIEI